jgi:hypothetical protein
MTLPISRGAPVFASPPMTWDSVSAGAGVNGPGPQGGAIAADATYGSGSVQLGIPAGLLSAPSSSFPVYVDPSCSLVSTELATAMVASGTPTTTYWNSVPPGRHGRPPRTPPCHGTSPR